MVRLSRGTWQQVHALRSDERFGDHRVLAMSARNGWKRVNVQHAFPASRTYPVSPHFLRHPHRTRIAPRRRSRNRAGYAGERIDFHDKPSSARTLR